MGMWFPGAEACFGVLFNTVRCCTAQGRPDSGAHQTLRWAKTFSASAVLHWAPMAAVSTEMLQKYQAKGIGDDILLVSTWKELVGALSSSVRL